MNTVLPLTALVEAGRKRRLLTRSQAERLVGYAGGKNLSDVAQVREWLGTADGLHPDLARKLGSLLPPADQVALGPYVPLAHLADGGMGSVWLAGALDGGGLVVVKTIKSGGDQAVSDSAATDALRRFERESKITRQLAHPNVVRCLDAGVSAHQTMFLVLEYVDSGDLRDLVEAKGGLTEALALAILYQVADGLAEADRLKLIHRDIKPPNIFVASTGQAKLADFGIARSTESSRTMLTMEGSIVGSPMYMSPEQILTDPTLDVRSDIYALGAVLYFCLAAEPPYNGKLPAILHQHCTAPVPDICIQRPKISPATQGLIATAMAKDRTKRFQTPAALRSAIGAALEALGLQPGTVRDESTAMRDLGQGTERAVARDIATLTADLRKQSGLDELETIADSITDSSNQATMAADLSGGDRPAMRVADLHQPSADLPTIAADLNAMATMTAVLLAQENVAAPLPSPKEPGTSATVLANEPGTIARILAGHDRIKPPAPPTTGDPALALTAPWLALTPADGGTSDQPLVFLFAQTTVRMGKLREAPVDLCLRNYPVAVHKDALQRLSRHHVGLRYDAVDHHCLIEDLNAPNGTRLDGIPLVPGSAVPLVPGVDNIVELAGVVVLWLRCLPRSTAAMSPPDGLTAGPVGLDGDCRFDAVTIARPENRPELAYAQVLRRLSLGGPGADLALAGARTRTSCEVGIIGGAWWWRAVTPVGMHPLPWQPLTSSTDLDCGGRRWRAAPARHEQYG